MSAVEFFYVFLFTGNDSHVISQFEPHLDSCFFMKDLEFLNYFLGIDVARDACGLYLSEGKYALDIISKIRLSWAKPASTTIE